MASKLYRITEGRQLSGVCAGLEACGRGNATGWRLLFLFGSLFWLIAVFVYFGMAVSIPLVKSAKEARELSGADSEGGHSPSSTENIERELLKLKEMKESGIINDEEYSQLRKKSLGL